MAAFHYKLEIVPRAFLGEPAINHVSLDKIQEGLSPWENSSEPNEQFLIAVRGLLPIEHSWGETEEYVSPADYGSDIRLWWENGRLENIEFRFNPYSDPWSLMQDFLQVVREASYMLVEVRTGEVLVPEEIVLKERSGAVHS
ncbi:hypothetical protein ACOCLD_01980 [Pseudomonas sp. MAC6]|uniref:hypothetical protein n=1 Tax=Pseudomonas sp. MAC6 TaxID=3401633 RepID=UPI003BF54F85